MQQMSNCNGDTTCYYRKSGILSISVNTNSMCTGTSSTTERCYLCNTANGTYYSSCIDCTHTFTACHGVGTTGTQTCVNGKKSISLYSDIGSTILVATVFCSRIQTGGYSNSLYSGNCYDNCQTLPYGGPFQAAKKRDDEKRPFFYTKANQKDLNKLLLNDTESSIMGCFCRDYHDHIMCHSLSSHSHQVGCNISSHPRYQFELLDDDDDYDDW